MQLGSGDSYGLQLPACVCQNDIDSIGMESGAVASSNRSKMAVSGVGGKGEGRGCCTQDW